IVSSTEQASQNSIDKWWYSAFHNVTAMVGTGVLMVLVLSWVVRLRLQVRALDRRPQQLIVEVGVNIVYMVTGGKSLKKFHDTVCPDCKQIMTTSFIMIFASLNFVLSQLPNFNSFSRDNII
ncbi:hypothetical protein Taro_006200, partial [Colocasia esculenta]|nr:hypothetical protein [Colocasia esculenta]